MRGTIRIRDLLELTSFLLSDGGLSPRGKESWTIYLRNKDQKIIEKFQNVLFRASEKKGSEQKRKDGTKFVKLHSKELGKELLKLSPTYRTSRRNSYPPCPGISGGRCSCSICGTDAKIDEYPPVKIPDEIFTDVELAKKFVKIYASCDGGVSVTFAKKSKYPFLVRKIFISVTPPELKKQLISLLRFLGFSPREYDGQIRLTTKFDIKKFEKIGFIEECKITDDSPFLSGLEKNFVLQKIINSYDNPSLLINFLKEKVSQSELIRD